MKVSLRINGRVTSVQVRDSIASLYCVFMKEGKEVTPRECECMVQDAVYDIATTWEGNGRGLGSYITDKLIEDMLYDDELQEFKSLVQGLGAR